MSNKYNPVTSNIYKDAENVGIYVAEHHAKNINNPDFENIFKAWIDAKAVLKCYHGNKIFSKNELKIRKLFVDSYTKHRTQLMVSINNEK